MDFKIKPYAHQLKAIEMSMQNRDLGLFWEMGAGKTGATVNILRLKYAINKRIMRTLITSPVATLHNWKREILMHSKIPEDSIVILSGGTEKILKAMVRYLYCNEQDMLIKSKIVLINYEAIRTEKVLQAMLHWNPEIIVADESQRIKSHKAAQSKAMVKLGDGATHRIILSGTPILNKPFDIYNQFRFLDKGETFGKNIKAFMMRYMIDDNAGWAHKDNHFAKYVLREDKADELIQLMSRKCYRISKAEALPDLPPLIRKEVMLEMSTEMRSHYDRMARDYITYIKDKQGVANRAMVAQTAMTKALRLLQITAGILCDEEGNVSYITDNPKSTRVRELLEEIVIENGHKCILWTCFKPNYQQLIDICNDLKIEFRTITGEDTLEEKNRAQVDFENDDNVKVIIANRRAGGVGINLIKAKYSIVYARNFSLEDELQSEARNHRGGSQIHDSVIKIDLCFDNSLEPLTLQALNSKQNLADKLLDLSEDLLYSDSIKTGELKWN